MKRFIFAGAVILLIAGCGRTITKEQYIGAMEAIGCSNYLAETSPEAQQMLKDRGITYDQIVDFRKKMKPKDIIEIVNDISGRVMACHGITK